MNYMILYWSTISSSRSSTRSIAVLYPIFPVLNLFFYFLILLNLYLCIKGKPNVSLVDI